MPISRPRELGRPRAFRADVVRPVRTSRTTVLAVALGVAPVAVRVLPHDDAARDGVVLAATSVLLVLATALLWVRSAGVADTPWNWRLTPPSRGDLVPAAVCAVLLVPLQSGAAVFANALGATTGHTHEVLPRPNFIGLVVGGVLVVVAVPLLEELLFRGLILQGVQTAVGFWPAAGLSSLLFAAGHTAGATSADMLPTLPYLPFGLVLCVLARQRRQLTTGLLVHGARNLLALLLVALTG
jgi:membrane protease YdiL (CAAX protease family)